MGRLLPSRLQVDCEVFSLVCLFFIINIPFYKQTKNVGTCPSGETALFLDSFTITTLENMLFVLFST